MKNKINTTYIYVDESGTLPDPTDTVVIIAAVATTKPEKLEYTTKNTRNSPYKKNTCGNKILPFWGEN